MRITEWLAFLAPLLSAVARVSLKRAFESRMIATVLLIGGNACEVAWSQGNVLPESLKSVLEPKLPHLTSAAGYGTSDQCRECHPKEYDSWHRSFHRTMTQIATPESLLGTCDVTLKSDEQSVRLERRGNGIWANMADLDWVNDQARKQLRAGLPVAPDYSKAPRVNVPVTLVTGTHNFQALWVSSRWGNKQLGFPFVWLVDDKRWVPRKDTFIRDASLGPLLQTWNENCVRCHATGPEPRYDTKTLLFDTHVGELGIACEACHGPGARHVEHRRSPVELNAAKSKTVNPGSDPTIVLPERLGHEASSQVCGQCHGVSWLLDSAGFMSHGFTYRPGEDLEKSKPLIRPKKFNEQSWLPDSVKTNASLLEGIWWPDGIVRVTGREQNGLAESPCFQRGTMTCLSCHSIHASDAVNHLKRNMDGNRACLQCHEKFEAKIAEHSHHDVGSSGSLCYNCHMPYTSYGLLKAVRSHTILTPDVENSAKSGRLNACNLCHLDKTLAWTSRYLSEWYHQKPTRLNSDDQTVSAAIQMTLKGDAVQRSVVAWSYGWEPARKASGENWMPPILAPLLVDPYSAVRHIAGRALKKLPAFKDWEYDFVGSTNHRARAVDEALKRWRQSPTNSWDRAGPEVLVDPGKRVRDVELQRLLGNRDDHPVEMIE